ncbi:uncharacterized protein [Clytia hemisphaerica]|uniref:uncharacterized protein n=1 Tax=Clytia hemisphaerica TaxID=252671 RepID=UPI0034D710D0
MLVYKQSYNTVFLIFYRFELDIDPSHSSVAAIQHPAIPVSTSHSSVAAIQHPAIPVSTSHSSVAAIQNPAIPVSTSHSSVAAIQHPAIPVSTLNSVVRLPSATQTETLTNPVRIILRNRQLDFGVEYVDCLIRRNHVFHDMLRHFQTNKIFTESYYYFRIIDKDGNVERGVGDGVTKEVLTLFIKEFYTECCEGPEKTKCITFRFGFSSEKWKVIARVLAYGLIYNCFPARLSKVSIQQVFFGQTPTGNDLQQALFDLRGELFDGQNMDGLIDMMTRCECPANPMAVAAMPDVLHDIAHADLIQRPWFAITSMREVFKQLILPNNFDSMTKINEIIERNKIITPAKLLECFSTNALNALTSTWKAWKKYVEGLIDEKLVKLLKLLTGSDILPLEKVFFFF